MEKESCTLVEQKRAPKGPQNALAPTLLRVFQSTQEATDCIIGMQAMQK